LLKKVFLGGTCNGSLWRDDFIDFLNVDWFNPVVDNWNNAAYKRELQEREQDAVLLYCLTPLAEGYYSIAEVVDDSNKRPKRTVMLVKETDGGQAFTPHQLKSLKAVAKMVETNGGAVFWDAAACAAFINEKLSASQLEAAG
jgi:hypothetical protein